MTETCTNCRFGHTVPYTNADMSGVDHFCRLDPPQLVPPTSSALLPTRPDGWCGKWAAAKRRKAS